MEYTTVNPEFIPCLRNSLLIILATGQTVVSFMSPTLIMDGSMRLAIPIELTTGMPFCKQDMIKWVLSGRESMASMTKSKLGDRISPLIVGSKRQANWLTFMEGSISLMRCAVASVLCLPIVETRERKSGV